MGLLTLAFRANRVSVRYGLWLAAGHDRQPIRMANRPMIDKTGLKTLYAIDTEGWQPLVRSISTNAEEQARLADPTRSTLFGIFADIGLRLDATKGKVDVFVIDKIERPAAN